MRREVSVWKFLLTMFLAVGAAVAALPGCGDDTPPSESDTGYIPDTDTYLD